MTHGYIEGDLVRIKTEPNNITPNKVVYKFVDYVAIDNVLIRTINGIDKKDRIIFLYIFLISLVFSYSFIRGGIQLWQI